MLKTENTIVDIKYQQTGTATAEDVQLFCRGKIAHYSLYPFPLLASSLFLSSSFSALRR